MKKIIMTGGGTAGHVIPNIALMPYLKDLGFEIHYIGSHNGMEKNLITNLGVSYYGISTGKLRRYFDFKNFTDPFRIIKGFFEAKHLIKEIQPDIVFSKGGYVTVPVVKAAHAKHIPVILHESDMTPGLANKLSFSSADRICCSFPETMDLLPENKAILTGSPIRQELLNGNADKGRSFCSFDTQKPILLITGGSLGSENINKFIRSILDLLLEHFYIIHLCGKGKLDTSLSNIKHYLQFEYINKELPDLLSAADLVISRAGAGTINELAALHKPNLLIPLSKNASRGDQILNARSYEKLGYSVVLEEEEITDDILYHSILELYEKRHLYIQSMSNGNFHKANDMIIELIQSYCS